MKKGFVTIATGKKHYYELAANLVKSYRFFSENPLPFAIIAEEKNEYTALFDDVIITKEATRSFCDKFLLLKLCPYDETIFIDADSLVYGNINCWFDEFTDATDFSAPGKNVYPPFSLDDGAWYMFDGIGEYGKTLDYKCRMHAGVIYIRQGPAVLKMYSDCMELYAAYRNGDLHFHTCPLAIDECVFGVAMPLNKMKAIAEKPDLLGAYPCLTKLNADILHGKLEFTTLWGTSTNCGILLHWGTKQTFEPLYLFNIKCLNYLVSGKKNMLGHFLFEGKMYYHYRCFLCKVLPYLERVIRKIKSIAGGNR